MPGPFLLFFGGIARPEGRVAAYPEVGELLRRLFRRWLHFFEVVHVCARLERLYAPHCPLDLGQMRKHSKDTLSDSRRSETLVREGYICMIGHI